MPSERSKTKPLDFSKKKIAIVHDILFEYGGAERVLDELLAIFPQADLFTYCYNTNNQVIVKKYRKFLKKTSILSRFFSRHSLKQLSLFKCVSWLFFLTLDLQEYEIIISSCHSFTSKIVRKQKKAVHICYLYTPPRYLYDRKSEYFDQENSWIRWVLNKTLFKFMKAIDYSATWNPDKVVTISNHIRKLVDNTYGRDSAVIFPPVKIFNRSKITSNFQKKYYIFHSRLVSQKGIELAINTCNKYKLPLKVIGEGYLFNKMKQKAGETITFLGWVDDSKLVTIYAHAMALIYPAIDDDFGIVPVEAMGMGVPVIAFRQGGVLETVIDGKTGYFFDNYSAIGLKQALDKLKNKVILPSNCVNQAKRFSSSKFRKRMKSVVQEFS